MFFDLSARPARAQQAGQSQRLVLRVETARFDRAAVAMGREPRNLPRGFFLPPDLAIWQAPLRHDQAKADSFCRQSLPGGKSFSARSGALRAPSRAEKKEGLTGCAGQLCGK